MRVRCSCFSRDQRTSLTLANLRLDLARSCFSRSVAKHRIPRNSPHPAVLLHFRVNPSTCGTRVAITSGDYLTLIVLQALFIIALCSLGWVELPPLFR